MSGGQDLASPSRSWRGVDKSPQGSWDLPVDISPRLSQSEALCREFGSAGSDSQASSRSEWLGGTEPRAGGAKHPGLMMPGPAPAHWTSGTISTWPHTPEFLHPRLLSSFPEILPDTWYPSNKFFFCTVKWCWFYDLWKHWLFHSLCERKIHDTILYLLNSRLGRINLKTVVLQGSIW